MWKRESFWQQQIIALRYSNLGQSLPPAFGYTHTHTHTHTQAVKTEHFACRSVWRVSPNKTMHNNGEVHALKHGDLSNSVAVCMQPQRGVCTCVVSVCMCVCAFSYTRSEVPFSLSLSLSLSLRSLVSPTLSFCASIPKKQSRYSSSPSSP